MKKLVFLATLCVLLTSAANARNIPVPADDPSAIVTVPDGWKFEEIDFGYSVVSADKDIFFSVESATKDKVDAMMKNNREWMKENKIDGSVKPVEKEMTFNGLQATVFRFDTKDADGPTRVDFILISGGKNRVIFLTLWGSDKDRKSHASEIDSIMNSVKAIQ